MRAREQEEREQEKKQIYKEIDILKLHLGNILMYVSEVVDIKRILIRIVMMHINVKKWGRKGGGAVKFLYKLS